VLALTAWGDEAAVPQEGEVVAGGGLTVLQDLAERPDVPLALGEQEEDVEPGRGADLLEQGRRLLCPPVPQGGLPLGLGRPRHGLRLDNGRCRQRYGPSYWVLPTGGDRVGRHSRHRGHVGFSLTYYLNLYVRLDRMMS